MKLLIDTKSEKVCFAEAGNDVVEFLTGLLSLPLGTVVNLLSPVPALATCSAARRNWTRNTRLKSGVSARLSAELRSPAYNSY